MRSVTVLVLASVGFAIPFVNVLGTAEEEVRGRRVKTGDFQCSALSCSTLQNNLVGIIRPQRPPVLSWKPVVEQRLFNPRSYMFRDVCDRHVLQLRGHLFGFLLLGWWAPSKLLVRGAYPLICQSDLLLLKCAKIAYVIPELALRPIDQ